MSDRDVFIRIGRLVVSGDGAAWAADLETAIGEAIRRRLEGTIPIGTHHSLAGRIADSLLGHPQVASVLPLPDLGRPARSRGEHEVGPGP
jgi:hypothetical protein